jgi:hypothetical protein
MIRQAHTYLVGAMSGATLIAIAIAAFVVLVSAQVFRDWPIAALGDGGGESAVSKARPLEAGAAAGAATAAAGVTVAGAASPARAKGAASGSGGTASDHHLGSTKAVAVGGTAGGPSPAPVSEPGESGSGNPASSAPGSSGGGNATAQPSSPAPAPAPGGSGGSGGGKGSGSTLVPTPPSTSGALTETVNTTVNKVDETALGSTGVTGVTEGVVNGVAGPESAVGKVVDESVKAVGGLLGGNH